MKKQHIILAILISWLLGLSCCHWLSESKNKNTTTVVTDVKVWRKQLQEAERNYRQQTTALWQKQENLLKTGEKISALLEALKNRNNTGQGDLYRSISNRQSAREKKDTVWLVANGDSLEKQTITHLLIYRQQDSVQQLVTANLAAQIKNRDTIINIQENKYLDINKQLDYSLSQQQSLQANVKIYQREFKRMQRGSRLKNIGLIVLAGFTINKWVNR